MVLSLMRREVLRGSIRVRRRRAKVRMLLMLVLMLHRRLLLILSRDSRDGRRRLGRVERRVSLLLLLLVQRLLLLLVMRDPSFGDAAADAFAGTVAGRDSRVVRVSGGRTSRVSVEDGLDIGRGGGETELAVASGTRIGTTVGGFTTLNGALSESRRRRKELAVEGREDVGKRVRSGTERAGVEVDLWGEKSVRIVEEREKKRRNAPCAAPSTPQPNLDSSPRSRRSSGSGRT